MSEHGDAGLWIVTGLSLSLSEPPPEGESHPERNPVGPFLSRQAADEWAAEYVSQFHSGSWSVAPLYTPQTRGGEVAPGDETPVSEPTSKLPAASTPEVSGAQAERERRMDYAVVKGYELGYVEGAQAVLAAVEKVIYALPRIASRDEQDMLTAARAAAAAAGGEA